MHGIFDGLNPDVEFTILNTDFTVHFTFDCLTADVNISAATSGA